MNTFANLKHPISHGDALWLTAGLGNEEDHDDGRTMLTMKPRRRIAMMHVTVRHGKMVP